MMQEVTTAIEPTGEDEQALSAMAQAQNERNSRCAAGDGGGMMPEYLTPEAVRAMDRREVKENYALIIESMKHWQ